MGHSSDFHRRRTAPALLLAAAAAMLPVAAQAYVGPGAGLTAIGTLLALVAALVLAVVGFVWYPVKRMMRARKGGGSGAEKVEKPQ